MDLHARSSEVIRGQARSYEVFRHLAVSQHASELERFLGVAETAAAQVVGVPARQSCIIMYPRMPSCVIGSQPRVCLESAYRLGKRCGEHLHARRGIINGNQRTGWESEGYAARGRRSCTRPSLGR